MRAVLAWKSNGAADVSIKDRIRVTSETLLSDNWATLKTTTLDFQRNDGTWQEQKRETYDRGHGATILLYNLAKRSIILVRQFRYPAFVTGHDDLLIETPAGLLDDLSPEECIRAESEQETGYRVRNPRKVFEAYMSPGSVTEKLHFFVAEYETQDRVTTGGGHADEGEDIETLEVTIEDALAMVSDGRIIDGKTIMLIHYAMLSIFSSHST
jgi:nudix-type nucleoside diphosphatase (YffH/AdpP family)